MNLKRTLTGTAALLAAALLTAPLAVAAPPSSGHLLIRHQARGCHTWSYEAGGFRASQTISLARHATLTITNDDMMAHTLVQTSGPAALLKSATMGHMAAIAKVTFPKQGVYTFRTKAGEDYMPMKTTGPDNVLTLIVHVS